jgi:hypothetical protein
VPLTWCPEGADFGPRSGPPADWRLLLLAACIALLIAALVLKAVRDWKAERDAEPANRAMRDRYTGRIRTMPLEPAESADRTAGNRGRIVTPCRVAGLLRTGGRRSPAGRQSRPDSRRFCAPGDAAGAGAFDLTWVVG